MATMKFPKQSHLKKAQTNKEFSEEISLLRNSHNDWQVVAIFYAAIHLLQAYFTEKTKNYPQTHQRDHLVLTDPQLKVIRYQYRDLKTLSVSCRYMCNPTNQFDIDSAKQALAIIQTHIDVLLK